MKLESNSMEICDVNQKRSKSVTALSKSMKAYENQPKSINRNEIQPVTIENLLQSKQFYQHLSKPTQICGNQSTSFKINQNP